MNRRNLRLCLLVLAGCCFFISCERKTTNLNYRSLLQNPDTVDCLWDTVKIDFGTDQSKGYLVHGWNEVRHKKGDQTFSRINNGAALMFYCAKPSRRSVVLRARSSSTYTQHLTPIVNSKSLPSFDVSSEFADHTFQIPAEFLRYGRNTMHFQVRSDIAEKVGVFMDFLEFAGDGMMAPLQPAPFSCKTATSGVLSAPVPGGLAFYQQIPADSQLELKYSFDPKERAGVRINVILETENGHREKLLSDVIKSPRWYSRNNSIILDLNSYKDRIVRLTLQTIPEKGFASPEHLSWTAVRLGTPPESGQKKAPPLKPKDSAPVNVLFYVIDALRSDHLQAYGYPGETSPSILQFSRESTLFENAYAQTSWTRASIATILTGLYPSSHLTQNRFDALSPELITLPGQLRKAGYTTAAFTNQPNIGPNFGFDKAFQQLHLIVGPKSTESELLLDQLKLFLSHENAAPLFLYVHTVDTHAPFSVQKQFQVLPRGCDPQSPKMVFPQRNGFMNPSAEELACVVSLYDSAVHQADHYFGKALELLKDHGLYENSLIVLTADHGENFLEHDVWGHGSNLYQQDLRVPLIVHFPKGEAKGKRLSFLARHIDLFPTVMQYVGSAAPPSLEGESLLPMVESGKRDPFFSFAELKLDGNVARAAIWKEYKLIHKISPAPDRYEMFNLQKDPIEKTDISGSQSILFGYMKNQLAIWDEHQLERAHSMKKPPRAVLDKETEENLRALGYLQ